MLEISLKLMSGIDWSEDTGNSSGILMPFLPSETFPFAPSATERVWLGPAENSFKRAGVMVLTRFTDKFQPGCFCVQPPGKLIDDEQAKIPNGPGKGRKGEESFSVLWIQRP